MIENLNVLDVITKDRVFNKIFDGLFTVEKSSLRVKPGSIHILERHGQGRRYNSLSPFDNNIVLQRPIVLLTIGLLDCESLDENQSLEKGLLLLEDLLASENVLSWNPAIMTHFDEQLVLVGLDRLLGHDTR